MEADFDLASLFEIEPEEKPKSPKKPAEELNRDATASIRRRRRQLLVHSYIYYRLNKNLIDDHKYDEWARELIELQERYPSEAERVEFHDDFKDFKMGDSFALPIDQPWIHEKAIQLLHFNQ